MKKSLIAALILIFLFSAIFLSKNIIPSFNDILDTSTVTKDRDISDYIIDVELYPEKKLLSGKETISYINNENVNLDRIYFHLYPNAFKTKDTAPFMFGDFASAYPQGFDPGHVDIKNVAVDKKDVNYSIKGVDKTILEIPLSNELLPGDKIIINISFEVKIPGSMERFGVFNNTFNLGNWYPVAAVYDKTGWNLDPYYPIGDPFYSDVSNYNVKITLPEGFIPAATGSLIKEHKNSGKKTYEFEETSVRDFAFCVSKNFIVEEKIVDGTIVKCYYIEDKNNTAMESAVNSIKIFNRLFGKYPHKTYSVVETNFPSGMEYPGIVFIGTNFYKEKSMSDTLETIIVHETAHQWWYGTVGNDEIDEAWLDESLATYSEVLYYDAAYNKSRGKNYYRNNIAMNIENLPLQNSPNDVVLKPLNEFKSWDDYGPLVYNRGAVMLHSLKEEVGDDKFIGILRNYYSKYSFKNATTNDFISMVEETTKRDWDDFFDKWLKNKK